MAKKAIVVVIVLIGWTVICISTPSFLLAACRDDCYSNCCGNDSLCQTDDEVKCLSDCLKDCGGDSVPDVPAPQPADGDDSSGG